MKTNLWLTDPEKRRWLAMRKNAGRKIDPQTALVWSNSAYVVDPYGLIGDLTPEEECIGRIWFVRSPESEIAVCFYDLPRATALAIDERHKEIARRERAGEPTYYVDEPFVF